MILSNNNTIIDKFTTYLGEYFCPAIGFQSVPLLYSAHLTKWVYLEQVISFRFRLNVCLQWLYGYYKSQLAKLCGSLFPCRVDLLTASSGAAIRGSFHAGKFKAPEMLKTDVLIIPELLPIIKSDDETLGALMVAMEEGDVCVSLVKGMEVTDSERERVRKYGAEITEDCDLKYKARAAVITATHTIELMPENLREAFFSRFLTLYVNPREIPPDTAWKNYVTLRNKPLEQELKAFLEERYINKTQPDFDFAQLVLEKLRKMIKSRKSPRDVGDMRRMALAHHDLIPDEDVATVAQRLLRYCNGETGLTGRELISQYIYQTPHTLAEICTETGLKANNICNHLARMHAEHKMQAGKKYYYMGDLKSPNKGAKP